MNAGDLYTEKNDMANAMKEYGKAESMYPENVEMKFWHAVTMVNKGKLPDALPLFKDVFAKDANWRLLIPRLRKAEQLNCDDATEKKILSLK
jgi:predicted Zn-dependent protease